MISWPYGLLMSSAKSRPLGRDSWCFESLCPGGLKEKNLTRFPHKNSSALSILNCWWQLCKILRSHAEHPCRCRIRNHATRDRKEGKKNTYSIQAFHSTGFVIPYQGYWTSKKSPCCATFCTCLIPCIKLNPDESREFEERDLRTTCCLPPLTNAKIICWQEILLLDVLFQKLQLF